MENLLFFIVSAFSGALFLQVASEPTLVGSLALSAALMAAFIKIFHLG